MNLDVYIFNSINGFAGKWTWSDFMGIFLAEYLGYILLFVLFVLLVVDFKKYWRMVVESIIAALFVRFMLVELIWRIYFHPRPFIVNNINLLISHNGTLSSFPSAHASFYFALSAIIFGYNKKFGILFFTASFFIAISRIFVGVHWPSDILAGAVLGILMGYFLNKIFKKINIIKKSQ